MEMVLGYNINLEKARDKEMCNKLQHEQLRHICPTGSLNSDLLYTF